MAYESNILEIPVDKTKSIHDLVKWFEHEKVYSKKHPSVALPFKKNEFPAFFMIGCAIMIGMALIVLEEKGKLKVKKSIHKNTSPEDFLDLIKNSKTETKIEKLIESRYDLDLILNVPHYSSVVSEPAPEYNLNDVFGIWKNKKNSLDKIREEQWGKRK